MIFNQLVQFSGKESTVYFNFSAFMTSSSSDYIIYVVNTYITADSNNGYWVAGNEPNGGQWSGLSSFTNPEWDIVPIGTGVTPTAAEFNQYSPNNVMEEGSAGTITVGISDTAAQTVYDSSLSSTYSVEFSYNVPMFELTQTSMTDSNATFVFSNDLASTGQHPLATSFMTAVSVEGSGPYDYVSLTEGGHFAHYWGWLNAFTHYYWVENGYVYGIPTQQ
ncbi:hypothetical protein [Thermoplasma sp.]|uniref:hypothetical protein n=1 Tax=Thermoplasma sp. TaxID=1973142 RepID=UPI0012783F7D|nr:hypothetical protein [Thermoplasma sp.]KAA8922349.1 MAG: hypothetical protein F6Q11_05045 [Thermoplasma sp.]